MEGVHLGFGIKDSLLPQSGVIGRNSFIIQCCAQSQTKLIVLASQSPVLNSIEHFRALLKRHLNKFATPPRGIQELWERVCSIYPNFNE